MITEAILSAVFRFVGWLGGVFPQVEVPPWMADSQHWLEGVSPFIEGLHNWVAVDALANGVKWLLSLCALIIAIRLVRIVASFFTAGGGSAA